MTQVDFGVLLVIAGLVSFALAVRWDAKANPGRRFSLWRSPEPNAGRWWGGLGTGLIAYGATLYAANLGWIAALLVGALVLLGCVVPVVIHNARLTR